MSPRKTTDDKQAKSTEFPQKLISGIVCAVSVANRKGVKKSNIESGTLIKDFGLEGDAHAGKWHRQVSLLAEESIEQMRKKGVDVAAGDFAENITTRGIDLWLLPVGSVLQIGNEVLLKITQIGKKCHQGCAIFQQVGDCIMPRQGIFAKVIAGGKIAPGDKITIAMNAEPREKQ